MSEKPRFAEQWFEWFQKEELPRIYRQEKGLPVPMPKAPAPPSVKQVSAALEMLRRELRKNNLDLSKPLAPKPPLDWKLDKENED